MDGRGGCCIARYAGGGGAYDMSKVDKIMLRFRPIAPKPATVAGSSVSGGGSSPEMSDVSPRSGRGKRKYNTASNGNNRRRCNGSGANRKRKALNEGQKVVVDSVVTLNLLPEAPAQKASPAREVDSPAGFGSALPKQGKNMPTWLSFGGSAKDNCHDDHDQMVGLGVSADRTAVTPSVVNIVGSCVTVECVTDVWVDVYGLGWTDEERRVNLERDTCPGLISDSYGRVTWINEAYRKMVGQVECSDRDDDSPVFVWLVMKENVPVRLACHKAFTCRVRVQYQKYDTCGVLNGKEKSSIITVPCDVWRMDAGGFAWRLDVKAALCLGR